ncbi:T9SS type A sorting domain-containing protein [Arcicella aquatica]|uniref:T9SS type A sorting domain-containing protein n=1 Tax=Arcicella aquatica TaxID=217141 RepID=A0ABU5QGM1_9BACT|nr:T9SS type A sorting domain-containing protein [Arcicella aquatica]MEA5256192.1 T9SS type A sorting domain-containing protein [Arcicella aquatica]
MSQITSSSSYKKRSFSYFQPSHLSLDRNINYQRAAISQYFTNSLMVQTPKNYATKNEAQVVASTTSVETKVEESFSADDKLFNNDKISIWNIYPNPADDIATIKYNISSQVNEVKITFYNVLGSEIKEEVLDKDASRKEISTKDWGNGIYLYQLSADGRSLVTKKLLVRHQ